MFDGWIRIRMIMVGIRTQKLPDKDLKLELIYLFILTILYTVYKEINKVKIINNSPKYTK